MRASDWMRRVVRGALLVVWGVALQGCPSSDTIEQEGGRCDVARRCANDTSPVCGEDGQTYACAAMARCEGAIIDPSGEACGLTASCEDTACRLYCEHGYQQDANGCDTCACKAPPACPPVSTPNCLDGQEVRCDTADAQGCPMCTCEAVSCPALDCESGCEFGYVTGEDGCATCECVEIRDCMPPVQCAPGEREQCTWPEAEGCPLCECVPMGTCQTDDALCRYGYTRGEDGCPACASPQACEQNEECGWGSRCESDPYQYECCPDDLFCEFDGEFDLPSCPRACIYRPNCVEGGCDAREACVQVERDDCCDASDRSCTDDQPECAWVCAPL